MTETELRRMYVAACTTAFKDVRLFIRNIATIEFEDRVIKAGVKGQADVWGWLFTTSRSLFPIPLEIELKNVKTPQNPHQKAWEDYCLTHHVPYLLLRAHKGATSSEVIERWVRVTSAWLETLRSVG